MDFILSIFIMLCCVPFVIMTLQILIRVMRFDECTQDTIASIQLRKIVLQSYDVTLQADRLVFENQGRQMECFFRNGHVVITPGTQIFYSDLDQAYFTDENNCITIHYERDENVYEEILTCQ